MEGCDITLYEQVNLEKLKKVINCDNIPFETTDDGEWFEIFKKQSKVYSKNKYTSNGIEIKYTQPNKFGRYSVKSGLQIFQKDVRKYISEEFVRDFDFQNCHAVLLEQIFKKFGIYGGLFLEEYNIDRSATLKKYNIKDKTVLIKVFNNESEPNEPFRDLHNQIYKQLVPKLPNIKNL